MAHKKKVKKGKSGERKTKTKKQPRGLHGFKKSKAKAKSGRTGKTPLASGAAGRSASGNRDRGTSKSFRYIPDWIRAKSDRSKAAWRKRWDRGTAPIGPVGRQYIQETYGPTIVPSDFGPVGAEAGGSFGGGGGAISVPSRIADSKAPGPDRVFREREPGDEPDDFEDYYDDYDFYDREY